MLDANVCNPGCKYLRPGRQPLICIGKCLLRTLFWCAMRHMTESSEGQFWAQKTVGRPLGEDSKGEKRPRMDGFLAQNGPNVQWFSLDGRKNRRMEHIILLMYGGFLAAIWYPAIPTSPLRYISSEKPIYRNAPRKPPNHISLLNAHFTHPQSWVKTQNTVPLQKLLEHIKRERNKNPWTWTFPQA